MTRWWYVGGLPLTSHDRTEIDHIRLVFFQIMVAKRKRGPPGFQLYMIWCLRYKSKQSRHNQVNPSDPESCIVIGSQTWWDQNKQKTENRVDTSFFFQPSFGKTPALYGRSPFDRVTSEGVHWHTIISVTELFHLAQLISTYKAISGMLGQDVLNTFERRAARLSKSSAQRLKWKGVLLMYISV